MLRRNPEILAIGFLVLVLGAIGALNEASHFVVRNLSEDRQRHIERKVELIGRRIEEKAALVEERANRLAQQIEREAQRHAERAGRLARVWE